MGIVTGKRVLLAKPRGYCAGVDRAVQTVEEALKLYGPPIYVRKEIVHNKHVVNTLQERGAIFVEENDEVPEGSIVIFSAHGVAPEVYEQADARGLKAIDATCPLVTKVHAQARRYAREGLTIILVTHDENVARHAQRIIRMKDGVIVNVIDSDADGCVLNPCVLMVTPPGAAGWVEMRSVLTSVNV